VWENGNTRPEPGRIIRPKRKEVLRMKMLSQFLRFDFEAFSKGKVFKVIEQSEWVDFATRQHKGRKFKAVITKDDTQYKQKEGEYASNLYEKFNIKVPKDINVPMNAFIVPVNAVATVYGDYRNQLSVTADDIRVLPVNK